MNDCYEKKLHFAADKGDLKKVKELIENEF